MALARRAGHGARADLTHPPAPRGPARTTSSTNSFVLDVAPKGTGYTGTDFYNEWRGRNADGTPSTAVGNNTALVPVAMSTIPEFAKYSFEVFKAGASVADTFTTRIVTRPVSPVFATTLPWAEPSADALAYTDPGNAAKAAALSAATLSWSLPSGAPPVLGGYVFGRIYNPTLHSLLMDSAVNAIGDTSLALSAATERDGNGNACTTTAVPAFTATSGYREIGLRQTLVNGLGLRQNVHFVGRPAL